MGLLNYGRLPTEQFNPRSKQLDRLSPLQIVRLMNHEDRQVLTAIDRAQASIARAVQLITEALASDGRLFFVGAGTSGRLGVIEAAECPPTFGTPPSLIQAVMAGGRQAVFRSKEGSEDSEKEAVFAIRRLRVGRKDVVVGIAASGVTPFVRSALIAARRQKAGTVLLTCNPHSPKNLADVVIALQTGPEVLAGSTRLKAGTACKMTLNMLTTASMVQLGKVYGNRMVDLEPKSRKLTERGIRLVRELGETNDSEARRLFKESHAHVKAAIVMARKKISYTQAMNELAQARGFLKDAL
jgi:N-acetylmuramic acid 6-phosphate etherase